MASSAEVGKLIRVDDDTEVINTPDGKQRYSNVKYGKVAHKIFDPSCDVRVSVGSEIIKAHKDLLSAASDYFCAMFSHDMIEKEKNAIEICGVTPKGFRIVLEYFYHGRVVLDETNLEECLEAARFLQVDWLVKACVHFLLGHLTVETWSYAFDLADRYALDDVRQDLLAFFGLNLVALDEGGHLAELPLGWLTELLAGELYINASEELVLQAIVNWANRDFEARQADLLQLLKLVRFNLMYPEELANIPETILALDGVRQRVEAAMATWGDVYAQCVTAAGPDRDSMLPRAALPTLMALSTHDTDVIQYMRPKPGGGVCVLLSERLGCDDVVGVVIDLAAIATLGNFLFVAGGYECDSYNMTRRVHRYDPRFAQWLPVASLNVRRANFTLFENNSRLFAVGGSTQSSPVADDGDPVDEGDNEEPGLNERLSDSCEVYDPLINRWEFLPKLHCGCAGMGGCSLNGVAYVSGGMTDNPSDDVPVNYFYMLSDGDDVWTPLAPMLNRRQNHSMVAHGGKLYVCGGDTAGVLGDPCLNKAPCYENESYDPLTDQWTSIAATPANFGLLHKGAALLGDVMYVLGGQYSSRYVHEFDFSEYAWKEGTFCGHNLNRLLKIDAAIPVNLPTDAPVADVPLDESERAAVASQ